MLLFGGNSLISGPQPFVVESWGGEGSPKCAGSGGAFGGFGSQGESLEEMRKVGIMREYIMSGKFSLGPHYTYLSTAAL